MSKALSTGSDEETKIPARFKPRARLLAQLGEQLIKNESIALIELVKNSYDADAARCDIYMEHVDDPEKGIIIIEDDGYGMDAATVTGVWMEPGSDFKTKKFERREVTPKFKRLPIGEKGIGRFGVHKLGKIIEMTTKSGKSKEIFVRIDWTVLDEYKYLDEVPITIVERRTPKLFKDGKTGTSILISRLKKEWHRGVARDVKRAVTALISPFASKSSFLAEFDVADKPDWFADLLDWSKVKEYSLYHFRVVISQDSIRKFHYKFTPWQSMPKLSSREVSIEDKYVGTYTKLEYPDGDRKGQEFSLGDHKIGKVVFEGYVFDRDPFMLRLGVTDKRGFKEYLDRNCGIRVFRDGLRVYDYGEPENDWLGLDLRRVNNPGKRLSNNIVLAAVYMDRADSADLIEKSNREGFVENEAYVAFRGSILRTLDIIETLRYSDKQKVRDVYGPTRKSEPVLELLGDLKDYVDKNVKSKDVKDEIVRYLVKVEEDYKRINENLLKAAGAGLSMSVVVHEVEKIILEIEKVLKAEKGSQRVRDLVKHLSSLIDGYAEIIRKSTRTSEDLKEVIDQALFNTDYRLSYHGFEVVRQYRSFKGKAQTKLARSLLIGTLMNLFDNTIYWVEKAGRSKKRMYVGLSNEEQGYLNVVVADNGTGFLLPTDEITEPFVSAKPGGMGLGLHIASEIMLAQGGKIAFPDWGDFELPEEFKVGATITLGFKT